jgi:GTP-binding protein Era
MKKKCGYVALLGCPNAGKSTLMNAFLESKIAVVSNKPQTTRNKILGISVEGDTQLLFLDTPGIHKTAGLPTMNKIMNNVAWSVLRDSDFVCYLIDITKGLVEEDELWISAILQKYRKKVMLIASKSDKLRKEFVKEKMLEISNRVSLLNAGLETPSQCTLIGDIPSFVSSKRKEDVAKLRKFLAEHMPEGDWLYDSEDLTDKSQKFICSEFIREQLFRQLGKEIPYKVAVVVDIFEVKPNITEISATIIVEREAYKAIIIGKRGSRLKSIGTEARQSLERHLNQKVFLELFVKVQKGWTENVGMLSEFANLQDPSLD